MENDNEAPEGRGFIPPPALGSYFFRELCKENVMAKSKSKEPAAKDGITVTCRYRVTERKKGKEVRAVSVEAESAEEAKAKAKEIFK